MRNDAAVAAGLLHQFRPTETPPEGCWSSARTTYDASARTTYDADVRKWPQDPSAAGGTAAYSADDVDAHGTDGSSIGEEEAGKLFERLPQQRRRHCPISILPWIERCKPPIIGNVSISIGKTWAAKVLPVAFLLFTVAQSTAVDTADCSASTAQPTCSNRYYKVSDETNGLATSCAAVDQTADPKVGLDQAGCQAECDGMDGCDTINFRWKDPNFGGNSTCYRKNCGSFKVAACTLFSKHKARDVYSKACGASALYPNHVQSHPATMRFSGMMCPDETKADVAKLLASCADGSFSEPDVKDCAQRYYKLSDDFNEYSSNCPAATVADGEQTDPIVGLDQPSCQAVCDELDDCDTINFLWFDPSFEGQSTCYRRRCGNFDEASCSLDPSIGGRDVYTKACGSEDKWADNVLEDANGLFAIVQCAKPPEPENVGDNAFDETIICDPDKGEERTCADKYFKISDEVNGLATSCAAVDQTADPKVGFDLPGCQAECDGMDGCDTINFRWKDPNFGGNSTCYRKNCGNFKVAACTLFSKHKARDVYTKACGAFELHSDHIIEDDNGLFAGIMCPDETETGVAELLGKCENNEPTDILEKSCAARYYKVSDEINGLASSCAAVDQTVDPIIGFDQAGCQAACDDMDGCDTINFRVTDPNVDGESVCYRKNCRSFQTAACTLFDKIASSQFDVFTKACGSDQLWEPNVLVDGNGLFAGVKCPSADDITEGHNKDTDPTERVCLGFISTNRTNRSCDICSEWSEGGTQSVAASVRTCLIWEKNSATGLSSCQEYAPSALQLKQNAEYSKYLKNRWTEVGLCNGQYLQGTTCSFINPINNESCLVRDQPCHGGTELGGVAGVLSAGWQMTFGTAEDNHVCTMCGRGTYGSCEDACAYRRNFFWSGYNLGSIKIDISGEEIAQLYLAFLQVLPEEIYDKPQTLELTPEVFAALPEGHGLLDSNLLPSQSIYSIIQIQQVYLTLRDQLNAITVSLRQMEKNDPEKKHQVKMILSTSGVKVYETCKCKKCNRGSFQDGLGETSCRSCETILPNSDTEDTGTDGPEHCRCLASNDVYISSDGSHCSEFDLVRQGKAAAPYIISPNRRTATVATGICPINTHEMNAKEAGLKDQPADWYTCVSCPQGSSTINAERTEHDYGASINNCYCREGTYASSSGCASCPTMKTSPPNSKSLSECHLTDTTRLLAIVIPIGLVLFGALLILVVLRFKKKIAALEAEKLRAMQEKVNEATETVNYLAHPMILQSMANFMSSGRMVKHEDARTNHKLTIFDTTEELKGFKRSNTIVFFSHQWLSWSEPDPHRLQYNAMRTALNELAETKNLDLNNTYVWLDYTSIPQTHRALQRLSINSLTNYAGACNYFVIVAPGKITHANTGTLCDKVSYQDRAWCRAEQLAHGCRAGVDEMYIADSVGLQPVTWEWIKPSFKIFSANLTCCARGHEGMEECDKEFLVTPVLGLYCELLAQEKGGSLTRQKREVLKFMQENEEEVFPSTFYFSKPGKDQGEQRELFGDILKLLHELDLQCEDAEEIPSEKSYDILEDKFEQPEQQPKASVGPNNMSDSSKSRNDAPMKDINGVNIEHSLNLSHSNGEWQV